MLTFSNYLQLAAFSPSSRYRHCVIRHQLFFWCLCFLRKQVRTPHPPLEWVEELPLLAAAAVCSFHKLVLLPTLSLDFIL